jgi:hypothetical protein
MQGVDAKFLSQNVMTKTNRTGNGKTKGTNVPDTCVHRLSLLVHCVTGHLFQYAVFDSQKRERKETVDRYLPTYIHKGKQVKSRESPTPREPAREKKNIVYVH